MFSPCSAFCISLYFNRRNQPPWTNQLCVADKFVLCSWQFRRGTDFYWTRSTNMEVSQADSEVPPGGPGSAPGIPGSIPSGPGSTPNTSGSTPDGPRSTVFSTNHTFQQNRVQQRLWSFVERQQIFAMQRSNRSQRSWRSSRLKSRTDYW